MQINHGVSDVWELALIDDLNEPSISSAVADHFSSHSPFSPKRLIIRAHSLPSSVVTSAISGRGISSERRAQA